MTEMQPIRIVTESQFLRLDLKLLWAKACQKHCTKCYTKILLEGLMRFSDTILWWLRLYRVKDFTKKIIPPEKSVRDCKTTNTGHNSSSAVYRSSSDQPLPRNLEANWFWVNGKSRAIKAVCRKLSASTSCRYSLTPSSEREICLHKIFSHRYNQQFPPPPPLLVHQRR